MEDMLSDDRKFLCGDQYTLADVFGTVFCSRVYFKKENKMFSPTLKRKKSKRKRKIRKKLKKRKKKR